MNYSTRSHDAKLSTVLLAPLDRIEHAPMSVRVIALVGGAWQYVTTDAFSISLFLVLFSGICDYWLGVRAAKYKGIYTPKAAYAGAVGKAAGLLIAMLIRPVEYFIFVKGWGDTNGMLATAVALSLFGSDLQSIAHHRESFGAKPIPVLSSVLEWIQRFAQSRVPAPPASPSVTPQRRKDDGEGWEG